MRDPNRIKPLLKRLYAAWKRHPDLRLAQIIAMAEQGVDIFYMEDEDLVTYIEDRFRELEDNTYAKRTSS